MKNFLLHKETLNSYFKDYLQKLQREEKIYITKLEMHTFIIILS